MIVYMTGITARESQKNLQQLRKSFWKWGDALGLLEDELYPSQTIRHRAELAAYPTNLIEAKELCKRLVLCNILSLEGKYKTAIKTYVKLWAFIGRDGSEPIYELKEKCFIENSIDQDQVEISLRYRSCYLLLILLVVSSLIQLKIFIL